MRLDTSHVFTAFTVLLSLTLVPLIVLRTYLVITPRIIGRSFHSGPYHAIPPLCFDYSSMPHDYVLRHPSFLPDSTFGKRMCNDPDGEAMQEEILARQNPTSCNATSQLTVETHMGGFGSLVNSWMKPFMFALDRGMQYWSPGLGHFDGSANTAANSGRAVTRRPCPLGSSACWFKLLTNCETTEYLKGEDEECREEDESLSRCSKTGPINASCQGAKSVTGRGCITLLDKNTRKNLIAEYSLQLQGNDEDGYPKTVPYHYRHLGHFWYYNQLLAYLLRPNENFQEVLEGAKDAAGWSRLQRPMLSLHVRHGDACFEDETIRKKRRCDDLEVYMEKIIPLAKKYNVKSIYIATDDGEVVKDTMKYPEFTWLYQPSSSLSTKVIQWDSIDSLEMDRDLIAQLTLTDLFLLAEGDIFVGKFTSNIDRLAYSLLSIRLRGLAPYLSLDSTWCFDFGQESGNSTFGAFKC